MAQNVNHFTVQKKWKKQTNGKFIMRKVKKILARRKDYRKENKDKITKEKKEHYNNKSEEIKKRNKDHYDDNSEEIKKRKKDHYDVNSGEIKNKRKDHYDDNLEEIKKRKKDYYREKRANGRTYHCKNASIFSKGKSCGVPFTHAYAVIEQVLGMG